MLGEKSKFSAARMLGRFLRPRFAHVAMHCAFVIISLDSNGRIKFLGGAVWVGGRKRYFGLFLLDRISLDPSMTFLRLSFSRISLRATVARVTTMGRRLCEKTGLFLPPLSRGGALPRANITVTLHEVVERRLREVYAVPSPVSTAATLPTPPPPLPPPLVGPAAIVASALPPPLVGPAATGPSSSAAAVLDMPEEAWQNVTPAKTRSAKPWSFRFRRQNQAQEALVAKRKAEAVLAKEQRDALVAKKRERAMTARRRAHLEAVIRHLKGFGTVLRKM